MTPETKSHDHWATPKWLYKLFEFWHDPCTLFSTEDGLTTEWGIRTFVNPPYSDPLPWVKKAIEESKKGKTIVMLVKADSSTKWWFLLVESGAKFAWFISDGTHSGRLSYNETGVAAFPSALVFLP